MSHKTTKSKKLFISDKYAELLSVGPSGDPEDDICEESVAKTVDFNDSDYNSDLDITLSEFRKKNAILLEDVDKKYRGKKVSRKDLKESESSDNDADNLTDDYEANISDQDSECEEGKRNKLGRYVALPKNDSDAEDSELDLGSDDDANDSNDDSLYDQESSVKTKRKSRGSQLSEDSFAEGSECEESGDSDEEEDDDYGDVSISNNDSTFNHMRTNDASEEIQKGNSVQQQLNIWESLLELRIHSQKLLLSANKLPAYDDFKEFRKGAGTDFQTSLNDTRNNVTNILDKFLELQKLMIKQYPETKDLEKRGKINKADGMDEEIPSDTEDEQMENSDREEEESVPAKKRKISDYSDILAERHTKYIPYRNSVIQKWHDKTRIAAGNLKNKTVNSGSLISHIEFVLNDKERLRRRTQLKRSNYEILGAKPKVEETDTKNDDEATEKINGEDGVADSVDVSEKNTYNSEIFDDSDFYHHLLRDLIECKSSDQTSKQWLELQQLKNKMKRKIDTRATKGRKIRYVVHSKLVNFMAPVDNCKWTDEAKDELFSSVFGTRINRTA